MGLFAPTQPRANAALQPYRGFQNLMLCKCGCGRKVHTPGRNFAPGHSPKGKLISERLMKRPRDEEGHVLIGNAEWQALSQRDRLKEPQGRVRFKMTREEAYRRMGSEADG